MRASRQPLLLLLLLDDLVTIPEASDCNLYKCKDIFPTFLAQTVCTSLHIEMMVIEVARKILTVWSPHCNSLRSKPRLKLH